MHHGISYRLVRCVVIATVALTVIGLFMGPRGRPVRPSAEVSRFQDVLKRPQPPVLRSEENAGSLWAWIFNRVLFTFAEEQPDVFVFGARLESVSKSLIHQTGWGRPIDAAPFITALERWTVERCQRDHRRVAAANINQFVFEQRYLQRVKEHFGTAEPEASADRTPVAWRGLEGGRMRDFIVGLAREGRITLADFGDFALSEVVAALEPVPVPPDTCPRDRR